MSNFINTKLQTLAANLAANQVGVVAIIGMQHAAMVIAPAAMGLDAWKHVNVADWATAELGENRRGMVIALCSIFAKQADKYHDVLTMPGGAAKRFSAMVSALETDTANHDSNGRFAWSFFTGKGQANLAKRQADKAKRDTAKADKNKGSKVSTGPVVVAIDDTLEVPLTAKGNPDWGKFLRGLNASQFAGLSARVQAESVRRESRENLEKSVTRQTAKSRKALVTASAKSAIAA